MYSTTLAADPQHQNITSQVHVLLVRYSEHFNVLLLQCEHLYSLLSDQPHVVMFIKRTFITETTIPISLYLRYSSRCYDYIFKQLNYS